MSTQEARAQQSCFLVEQLRRSQFPRDYETANRETTGLPFSLRATQDSDLSR